MATKPPGKSTLPPNETGSTKPDVKYTGPADPVAPGTDGGLLNGQPDKTEPLPNPVTGKIPPSPGAGGLLDPKYVTAPPTETGYTAPQREVGENELASNQLTKLLAGDSKYMRQARQEGLELGGGLGGTQGIRSAYSSAIKAGAPIAIADAQAYRDAAAQNMDALVEFGLANINRQTQLELGVMDSNTRLQTTHMTNVAQMNIAKMQDITARDIAQLDADTRVQVQAMQGKMQERLADLEFRYAAILEDQSHGNRLEQIALTGEYDLAKQQELIKAQEETNYMNAYMGAYDSALANLAAMNGIEMDDEARTRATAAIWEGFDGMIELIQLLYPLATPIDFE